MSWLLWSSSRNLTGSYPGGQKLFRCTFSKDEIDMDSPHSKWQTSGNVSWTMGVINTKNVENSKKEELKVYVKCHLEDRMESSVDENWRIDADHIVRLFNHNKSNKHVCTRGSTTFTKAKDSCVSSLINLSDITDDFLLNDELTFEVEIGVKNSEGLPKIVDLSVKRPDSNVVLTVGKEKFYVDKEILSKKSTIFEELLKKEGVGKGSNEYAIEDVNPTIFHVFIKTVSDIPVQFGLDEIEELLKMSEKFKINEVQEQCKEFLINSVVDDALALKIADKHGMQDVIVEKLKPLNSISDLRQAFRYYRKFSDESMRLLLKKLIEVA
ncbi:hypothetical protein GCK72_018677 [Caenorhabditis remanei]|uniref:BTB domain-containing protein n=1 Tax=Caenorhabditis remanei TaxID=31234 RepID=A0A6A5GBT5_CAERE|nr:hypothetical protein GCK72_018677 [Caenorhabditis remanei]KAF1752123.1 hypothetical protein GCK72_018677 [Caenorhabditis remanei]